MERRLCIAPIFTNVPGVAPGSFSPVAIYIVFWDGPSEQGRSILQPLADAGPMFSSMGVMPYDQVLQLSHLPEGRYMAAGRSLSRLDVGLFDAAVAAVQGNSNFTFTFEDYQVCVHPERPQLCAVRPLPSRCACVQRGHSSVQHAHAPRCALFQRAPSLASLDSLGHPTIRRARRQPCEAAVPVQRLYLSRLLHWGTGRARPDWQQRQPCEAAVPVRARAAT
jgi:hypothetical protein